MKLSPVIVVNFKTYEQGTGRKGIRLARLCENIAKFSKVKVIVAVQVLDIREIAHAVSIPVFSQHIDPIYPGAYTGHILPEGLVEDGAAGVIINHSEDRFDLPTTKRAIARAKEVGLSTIVCAATPRLAASIAAYRPDFIAIEPPKLIGGEISVSTARPEIITSTIERVKQVADIPVLCGAGIKDRRDVEVAMKLGATGVLVASHVVKAAYPEVVLKELVAGI